MSVQGFSKMLSGNLCAGRGRCWAGQVLGRAGAGYLPTRFWSRMLQRDTSYCSCYCPSELNGKTLSLKAAHTLVAGFREIKLEPTWKSLAGSFPEDQEVLCKPSGERKDISGFTHL